MKRSFVFSSVAWMILLLSVTGCGNNNNAVLEGILPSRIENITGKDVVPEGSEGAMSSETDTYDASAFVPRMFFGTWKLQAIEGEMPAIEVPVPSGSGAESCSVGVFPDSMILGDTVRGNEAEVYRIGFDDYYYMQAAFKTVEDSEEDLSEFRMLFDVVGKTLAVGFTGEVTDERYYKESVDTVDIFETDYGFEWNGYELTLNYGGASAVYVPSTFEGDMQKACEGFSGSNGQDRMPDWHFSPLQMNGDGKGTVGTVYDSNVMMEYSFGEDGSFSITTEYGEVFSFDSYWYSDSCLTLPSGNLKRMYQHDYLSLYYGDPYRHKPMEANSWTEELTMAGKKLGSPLMCPVQKLIMQGYKTDVDIWQSMVPSGCVSPEFELRFRTAGIIVRAVNPTDVELPLGACIIFRYRFDEESGSILRRVNFFLGDDCVKCGETTNEDLEVYNNLFPVSDHVMRAQASSSGSLYDYDFNDYNAHVLEGLDGHGSPLFLQLEMDGEKLHAFSCALSVYENRNLDHNIAFENISELSQEKCESLAARRDEIAKSVNTGFADLSDVACDTYGTIYIPWNSVFSYGKAELSDEGKQLLDKVADRYIRAVGTYDDIVGVQTGVNARCDLVEHGRSFTVPRAEVVSEYLNDQMSQKGGKFSIYPIGYGETEYLQEQGVNTLGDNIVSIRFILDPASVGEMSGKEISLIYKEAEGEASFRYMKQDAALVGEERAAYAEKYSGTYNADSYTNEAIGMKWKLPEGWHFYDDDELTAYNGMSAEELLIKKLPIYIFAAVNDDYDTMIDVRLYPCDAAAYETAGEEFAKSLFDSYESVCRTNYTDVTAETENVTLGGRTVKKGSFRFTADDQEFVRKQYYLVFPDAAVVITLSGTEDSKILDDPGLR